jgi:hypothetical protein
MNRGRPSEGRIRRDRSEIKGPFSAQPSIDSIFFSNAAGAFSMYAETMTATSDLKSRVARYLADRNQRSLRSIQVATEGGVVTLQGNVGSFYEKQLALACCRRVAGVTELVDRVCVD